jgi:hypothetical protein
MIFQKISILGLNQRNTTVIPHTKIKTETDLRMSAFSISIPAEICLRWIRHDSHMSQGYCFMMKRFKTFLFSAVILCSITPAFALTVRVSTGVKIDPVIVRKALIEKDRRFEALNADIVVYGCSTGKEVYTLKKGELDLQSCIGEIQAVVKFPGNPKIKKALFLKGKGADAESLSKSLADDALAVLG